jgi:hypothetical protein
MKKNKFLAGILALALSLSIATPALASVYTAAIATADVTIDNVYGVVGTTTGSITIAANKVTSGDVITIKVGTAIVGTKTMSATDAAKATSIDVKGLTQKAGKVSILVSPTSTPTAIKTISVAYLAQKSPVVEASKITVQGYADQEDVLTMAGVETGDIVSVYPSTATLTPLTGTAAAAATEKLLVKGTSTGTSIAIKLGKNNITTTTGITVSITKKNCSESNKVLLKGDALKLTPATLTPAVSDTTAIAVPGGLLVYGIKTTGTEKYTITAYSVEPYALGLGKNITPTQKTALTAKTLGKATTVTNNKASYIFIPFKNTAFTADLASGAKVYVVAKFNGTTKANGKALSTATVITVK